MRQVEASAFQGWKRSGLCLTSRSNGLAQSPGVSWSQAARWFQCLASSTVYTEDDPSGAFDTTKNPSPHVSCGLHSDGLEGVSLFEIETSPMCWRRKRDLSWFQIHFSKLIFEAKVRGKNISAASFDFPPSTRLLGFHGWPILSESEIACTKVLVFTPGLRGIFVSAPYRSTPSRHLHALCL